MYVNALLLSDITMPNGQHIEDAAYNGDHDALHSNPLSHSINQSRPNDKAWHEWRRCLNTLCQRDSKHVLKDPLRAWTVQGGNYARQWLLLYSQQEDAIYHHTAVGYSVYRKLWHDYDKDTEEYCEELPMDAAPIDIRETPHTWIRPRRSVAQDLPHNVDELTTIQTTIETMPIWERTLLQAVVFNL